MSAEPPHSAGAMLSNKLEKKPYLLKKTEGPLALLRRIFVFSFVLLSIAFASGTYLPDGMVLAAGSASSSYRLDYARFTSDSDQKTSSSYQLTDSISDISVEGSSASYNLRNVYSAPTASSGPVCGNGIIETGEQCEGADFGGLTCASYGLNSGNLQCVSCLIVTSGCFNSVTGGSGYWPGLPTEPDEPMPEEPADAPETPFVFEPEFDPGLPFEMKRPETAPAPETPIVKPELPKKPAPEESEEPEDLKPAAPEEDTIQILSQNDYHFSQFDLGETITVLDETPFVVTNAKPNTVYEMVITDANENTVVRQGVQSSPKGILMFEALPFLEYSTYKLALYNENRLRFKAWYMTIEDRPYREHDNLRTGTELSREQISLGTFKRLADISGIGKPDTRYHAYLQKIRPHTREVAEIIHITATADSRGSYRLILPDHLENGSYLMNVVQVYEDGKVSRNKRYFFAIETPVETRNFWVLMAIGATTLLGQWLKPSRKNRRPKGKILVILALSIGLILQSSSVLAAVTTPAVFIYEGKLLDSSNNPITSTQTFRFSLWNSDDFVPSDLTVTGAINPVAPAYGGWLETHNVTPNTDGTFFVELGSGVPLPNMLLSTHTHLMVEIKAFGAPDTAYELMDPTGDNGADTNDRQTIGSVPYANNADFIDNAEVGTGAGNIATLGIGGVWNIDFIPGGTNSESWTIDANNTAGAGSTIDLFFGAALAQFLSFDILNDWFSFSNDVNFNQHEIKNVAIDNLAAPPPAPVTGQIYHNTTDGNSYIWNGISWDDITAGASAADDLDTVYGADADKKMAVNHAAGLEFESTTAGDIVIDLQSTGDFVIQDAGTPFAIFTDSGQFGLGTTSPVSIFHIDSNAANTTPIMTLENTAGSLQFFRTDTTPEGAVTGSIGDLAIDGTNGSAYIKNSGNATSTGWLQFGGQQEKTAVFHAEYKDATIQADGTSNKGLLSSHFADAGGTSKYNYYEWISRQATLQNIDIVISFRLPQDFISFSAAPLSILYQTGNAVPATNQIDVFFYDTTGTAVALAGGTDLANGAWTTANITFGGVPTFTAGGVVTLVIKPQTTNAGFSRVSDVIFNYNGT